MNFFDATILGTIEGLTEFLPISSTGHLILVSTILNIQNHEFLETFEICIQLGAILAIVFLYARKFLSNLLIYKKLTVAFIPTGIIGFLLYKIIKTYLFSPLVVSIALVIGGIALIILDKKISQNRENTIELENISYRHAAFIGLWQSLSVIPGVSRAAATIVGGVFNGLNKKQAMEFSFLLAVPTMLAASGYDLLKTSANFSGQEILLLLTGSAVAFVIAGVAVKLFLNLVEKYGFAFFGYYRIIIGLIFLWLICL